MVGAIDDVIIDPIVAYFTNPTEEQLSAARAKFLEGVVKVTIPGSAMVIDAAASSSGPRRIPSRPSSTPTSAVGSSQACSANA